MHPARELKQEGLAVTQRQVMLALKVLRACSSRIEYVRAGGRGGRKGPESSGMRVLTSETSFAFISETRCASLSHARFKT